jgi:hypothetical protein
MTSASGNDVLIASANNCVMVFLIAGKASVKRLSQYIGDFHPDAHVNGASMFSFTASASSSALAMVGAEFELTLIIVIDLT